MPIVAFILASEHGASGKQPVLHALTIPYEAYPGKKIATSCVPDIVHRHVICNVKITQFPQSVAHTGVPKKHFQWATKLLREKISAFAFFITETRSERLSLARAPFVFQERILIPFGSFNGCCDVSLNSTYGAHDCARRNWVSGVTDVVNFAGSSEISTDRGGSRKVSRSGSDCECVLTILRDIDTAVTSRL